MFNVLKELYIHCEEHGRSDIGAEVVDALGMCQADFKELVVQLQRSSTDGVGGGAELSHPPLVAMSASPLAQRANSSGSLTGELSPARQSPREPGLATGAPPDSPDSNSRMLKQFESMDIEQLQEAARYFSTTTPGHDGELVPREVHDALYLKAAAAEGREEAAMRFLGVLQQMSLAVHSHGPSPRPSPKISPKPSQGPLPRHRLDSGADCASRETQATPLVLPVSLAEDSRSASAAASDPRDADAEVGEDGEGWLQPKNKRRSRRRRLWEHENGEESEAAGPRPVPAPIEACPAPAPASEPPTGGEPAAHPSEGAIAALCEPRAADVGDGASLPTLPTAHSNKPLPTWTSWADECEDDSNAAAQPVVSATEADEGGAPVRLEPETTRRKKKKTPPPSFLATSPVGSAGGAPGAGAAAPTAAPACASRAGPATARGGAVGLECEVPPSSSASFDAHEATETARAVTWSGAAVSANTGDAAATTGGGTCVMDVPAGCWGGRPSFAAIVRGSQGDHSPTSEEEAIAACEERSRRESTESNNRREKLLSPEKKSETEIREFAARKQARAEAARELRAAEEAHRLQKQREREELVRSRKEAAANERRAALEERMSRAEASHKLTLTSVAQRARKESQKVQEVAFIKAVSTTFPHSAERQAAINLKEMKAEKKAAKAIRMAAANDSTR